MVCVAVTRGGFGDVWRFDNRTEAYLHPLVQFGDALLTGTTDLLDQYNSLEWGRIRKLAGMDLWSPPSGAKPSQLREIMEYQASSVFDALVQLVQPAPTDAVDICRRVTEDRRLGVQSTVAKKNPSAPADPAPAEKVARERSNLPPAPKGPRGVPQDAVIAFGVDKNGVPYGADNNPKKVGSKTHGRFSLYQEGMTVQQALDAGIQTADLVYDQDRGFVTFSGGTPAAEAQQEGTEAQQEEAAD